MVDSEDLKESAKQTVRMLLLAPIGIPLLACGRASWAIEKRKREWKCPYLSHRGRGGRGCVGNIPICPYCKCRLARAEVSAIAEDQARWRERKKAVGRLRFYTKHQPWWLPRSRRRAGDGDPSAEEWASYTDMLRKDVEMRRIKREAKERAWMLEEEGAGHVQQNPQVS